LGYYLFYGSERAFSRDATGGYFNVSAPSEERADGLRQHKVTPKRHEKLGSPEILHPDPNDRRMVEGNPRIVENNSWFVVNKPG
jgi:hypothetical protein